MKAMGREQNQLHEHAYQAFYCEENVWHLCQSETLADRDNFAVFISNAARRCPLWNQRAARIYGEPVVWDYHVVLLSADPTGEHGPQIWDMDTRLGYPLPVDQWWQGTFPPPHVLPEDLQPCSRVISAQDYIEHFSSDRSHMRTEEGRWRAPPPAWPVIAKEGHPINLEAFIDMDRDFLGEVLPAKDFLARYGPEALRR